jgi:hypothetical protein
MPTIHLEGFRMILITATINEQPDGSILVRFSGQDIMGTTDAEGDVADALREAMVKKRDEIFEKGGYTAHQLKHIYTRAFDDPEERDKRI